MRRLRRSASARAAGALALAALGGCSPSRRSASPAPANVLLLTLDTFRADRAGCMGHPGGLTPELDCILREGMLAREAYAPAPLTAVSHCTLLTGLDPPNHGVRENGSTRLSEDIPSLPLLLHEAGFRTAAFIAAFPLVARFGFAQGFDHFDEHLEPERTAGTYYAERPAREVVDAALEWVKGTGSAERWFLWAHFFDPHHPRRVVAELRELPAASDYEREIRGMDAEIHRLLRELEALGAPLVVAVVSDHGEALGAHGESSHGVLLYEETMRGLFGLAAPPRSPEGRRLPRGIAQGIIRYTDLVPTLLDLLGLERPASLDGRSLLAPPPPEELARGAYGESYYSMMHYGWSPLLSWRTRRWSYIQAPEPELYDRCRDPREVENVIDQHPDVAEELAGRIARLARHPRPPSREEALEEDARAKLAALGYVAGAVKLQGDPKKDPKKLVRSVDQLHRGILLVSKGRPREALPLLQAAFRADPDNASALFHLANCLRQLGESATAIAYYRRAIERNPGAGEAYAHLALLEFDRGNREVAFELLERGRARSPESFALLMTSGDLHAEVGRVSEAERLYRAAAQAEARRVEPWARLAALAGEAGRKEEARRLWKRAEELDPGHPLVREHARGRAPAGGS